MRNIFSVIAALLISQPVFAASPQGPKNPGSFHTLDCKVSVSQIEGTSGSYPKRTYHVVLDDKHPMLTHDMKAAQPIELEDGSELQIHAFTGAYGARIGKNGGGLMVVMRNGSLTGEAEVREDGKNYGYPFGTRDWISSAAFNVFIVCAP